MKRLILIILSITGILLTSFSCSKDKEYTSYLHINFYPRVCKYVLLSNSGIVSLEDSTVYFLSGNVENSEAANYLLHISITSYKPFQQKFATSADFYCCEHDKEKEKLISADLRSQYMPGEEVDQDVEYRLDYCTSIKMTASSSLFGRSPGEDLSDKFIFRALPYRYSSEYYFSGDGDLKTILDQMSVDEYLNSNPTAFADGYLGFKEKPKEIPLTTQFTVEVTLGNGKTLEGRGNEITLE